MIRPGPGFQIKTEQDGWLCSMDVSKAPRIELPWNLLLSALLAVPIALLWLVPLSSSFWIDEIATVFVVRQGPAHPSLAVAPQVTKSIYFFLPRIAEALLGFSETAYRLPSIMAMAIALFLVARLSARLIHPKATWFAVFACLALRGINYQAADARSYAVGTCVAAASFLFLIRWLDSAGWVDALLFAIFAGLLWRVHLIFWPLYIVFAIYALVRLARGETRVVWLRAGALFSLVGLSLLPVLFDALSLLRQAEAHVVAPVPSFRDLAGSLKLGLVAACGAGSWLLCSRRTASSPGIDKVGGADTGLKPSGRIGLFQSPPGASTPSWSSITVILGWWLCQPLCLFVFSRLSGDSVFVPRYLFVALPGGVLASTLVAGYFIRPADWKWMSLLVAAGVSLNPGQWRAPWPRHDNSDWRAAASQINKLALGPETPVICPSPYIEARPPEWRPDYPLPGFLYAHLLVYPIRGKPYPLPFTRSPDAELFAATLSKDTLSAAGRFVVYGWDGNVQFWRSWFAQRPELAGWNQRSLGPFGNIDVVVFEKNKAPSRAMQFE